MNAPLAHETAMLAMSAMQRAAYARELRDARRVDACSRALYWRGKVREQRAKLRLRGWTTCQRVYLGWDNELGPDGYYTGDELLAIAEENLNEARAEMRDLRSA